MDNVMPAIIEVEPKLDQLFLDDTSLGPNFPAVRSKTHSTSPATKAITSIFIPEGFQHIRLNAQNQPLPPDDANKLGAEFRSPLILDAQGTLPPLADCVCDKNILFKGPAGCAKLPGKRPELLYGTISGIIYYFIPVILTPSLTPCFYRISESAVTTTFAFWWSRAELCDQQQGHIFAVALHSTPIYYEPYGFITDVALPVCAAPAVP